MEKKSNSRSSQSQTKTQNIEPKKSQDASVNKPWPRSNKKRESPSNGSSRSDANRKPPPQKNRAFDKRPKPRGAYHGGAMGGKADSRLEEENAEVGSVFLPGSKKHNLNHLLNFQFASREEGGASRGPRRPHGLVYTNSHKHNKELFLQSNCQFVVKADGNYAAHLIDPDIPVNWDLVEQINVRVSEVLTCPICLGEVVAGRITRCGHSYCWPCLLHYFALSEEATRPCPICFQPIEKKHLRSVQGVWQETIPVDGEIHMRLMRRSRGSTIVEQAPELTEEEECEPRDCLLSVTEKLQSTLFSKLLTANPQEVMDIINREREELSNQLAVESNTPEYCFIQEALNQLQNRESALLSLQCNLKPEPPKDLPKPVQKFDAKGASSSGGLSFLDLMEELEIIHPNNTEEFEIATPNNTEGADFDASSGLNPDAPVFQLPSTENKEIETNVSPPTMNQLKDEAVKSKYYYFYQASDGQAVFLEGLDVRVLECSWGSLARAPRQLRAAVLRRTSGSVDGGARRRLRCLAHLPIHCPYDMVQVDLKLPFVTKEALAAFKGDLEERKRQLARKVREERRRERVISQQEQSLLGRGPGLRLSLLSEHHFPACSPPQDLLSSDLHFPICSQSQDSHLERDEDDSPTASSSMSEGSASLSFAKMASGSGSWRHRAPCPTTVAHAPRDSSSEGEAGAPSYHVSLSEAISAAMLSAPTLSVEARTAGSKKKKQKAKVLFSTGIQHYN